jgi:hypothetical protein
MTTPKNIKKLQEASRDLQARQVDKNTYVVESRTNPNAHHIVTIQFDSENYAIHARCSCAWAIFNGIACSHVLAALEYVAARKQRTLSFWTDEEAARRQKHRLFQLVGKLDNKLHNRTGIWITSRRAA